MATTLAELVHSEAVATELAARDFNAMAEKLNAPTERGPVPIIDLSAYCTVNGITGAVEWAAHNHGVVDCRKLCFGVLSILRTDLRLNTADLDNPAFDYMTDSLIFFELLTADQKAEIHALGDGRRGKAKAAIGRDCTASECLEAAGGD